MADGRSLSLVFDMRAFAEDCGRADIIVTPLRAPTGCAARLVIDRDALKETGALTLSFPQSGVEKRAARAVGEDRPWSRAPKRQWAPAAPIPASHPAGEAADAGLSAPGAAPDSEREASITTDNAADDASPLE
jgi:competence protein ComEC